MHEGFRQFSYLAIIVVLASACADPTVNQTSADKPAEPNLPPAGFLDAPPPLPVSDTIVLSGGNLILDAVTTDTAIVLQQGKLMAWGKRGEVDMPNDSIGKDLRGKWITPGTLTDLEAATLPNLTALKVGAAANMLVFKTGPDISRATSDDLYGTISNGELQILDASE